MVVSFFSLKYISLLWANTAPVIFLCNVVSTISGNLTRLWVNIVQADQDNIA